MFSSVLFYKDEEKNKWVSCSFILSPFSNDYNHPLIQLSASKYNDNLVVTITDNRLLKHNPSTDISSMK